MTQTATGTTAAVVVAIAVSLATGAAAADRASPLWHKAAGPTVRAAGYQRALARGDHYAVRAADHHAVGHGEPANAMALRAAAEYERAVHFDPRASEPHYRAAELLYLHFVDQTDRPRRAPAERAVRHWNQFVEKAPRDPRVVDIYFRRSLTHTKLGGTDNYKRAAADYEAELQLLDRASANGGSVSLVLSNAAEVHMALGNLDRAIDLYFDSMEFADRSRQLYAHGLAVALDRDGQEVKAREVLRQFGGYSPDELRRDGVFFIPDGDIYYYHAVGKESVGELESARNYYKQYLRWQPQSPYAERARQHIRALDKKLRRAKPAGRRRRGDNGTGGAARAIERWRRP